MAFRSSSAVLDYDDSAYQEARQPTPTAGPDAPHGLVGRQEGGRPKNGTRTGTFRVPLVSNPPPKEPECPPPHSLPGQAEVAVRIRVTTTPGTGR
jgi:hypothetical protein